MNTGIILFLLFIMLLMVACFGVYFNVWLENYYAKKDIEERERMIQEGQAVHCPDKLEARD